MEVNQKAEKALEVYNSMKWNYLFQAHEVRFESKPLFHLQVHVKDKEKYFPWDIGENEKKKKTIMSQKIFQYI